jgi:hypothetical protein
MPAVTYFRGRPAHFWIAAMSNSAQSTAADPAAATSARPRPAAPAARRAAPAETGASVVATVDISAWRAWASNWFTRTSFQGGTPDGG